MNAKKAKALRKEAVKLASDSVGREYKEGNKGVRLVPDGTDPKGSPKFKERDITGTIRLVPWCARAIYKALKRAA